MSREKKEGGKERQREKKRR